MLIVVMFSEISTVAFYLRGYENSLLRRLQGPMNTFGRFDSTEGKRAVPSSLQTALCKIETVALDRPLLRRVSRRIVKSDNMTRVTRCDRIRL